MNVQTVDFTASNASEMLAQSLRETGFAVLTNHPISPDRIESAYTSWADFFADENKNDWLFDPENQDGFFPFKSENAKGATQKDLKEFYHGSDHFLFLSSILRDLILQCIVCISLSLSSISRPPSFQKNSFSMFPLQGSHICPQSYFCSSTKCRLIMIKEGTAL